MENETPFIWVWKSLPNRRVLKTLRGSPKGKAQRRQCRLAVGLGRYKWYQKSQTLGDVRARRLFPEGGRHEAVCQSRRSAPRGLDLLGVPHRLEKGTSASEDAGLRRGVDCEILHRLGGERNTLYKGVETSP